MDARPRLSVIIPVHNGEHFIGTALGSVLAQTRAPDQIVVVDDGSSDGTAAILAGFDGVTVHQQENLGAGAARNLAVERSTGELLAFLDADDVWLPDKLALQERALAIEPRADLVFGHVRQFRTSEGGDDEPPDPPMPGYIPSAMLLTREAFHRVGWFDTARELPEFAIWFLRAQEAALSMRIIPEVVAHRRLHANNKGTIPGTRRGYLLALKHSLDRRRTARTPTGEE